MNRIEKEKIIAEYKKIIEGLGLLFDNENEHYKECDDDIFFFFVNDEVNKLEAIFIIDFVKNIWYLSDIEEPPYGHSIIGKPRKINKETLDSELTLFLTVLFDIK